MSNEYILQEAINILDDIASQICDEYCKYPHQFSDDDQGGLYVICESCPVNRLTREGAFK